MSKEFSMNEKDIMKYLEELNELMKNNNIHGDINLVGGAVMCLAFKSRKITHDIDGIFEPKSKINDLIKSISVKNDIPENWLNDGVKGFLSKKANFQEFKKLSNLTISIASPEYMLAMKCLSARADNKNEIEDLKHLIKKLNLKTYEDVVEIILQFYPMEKFMVKTQYLIMEVLESVWT